MNAVAVYLRDLVRDTRCGWDRFWFTPADPSTLCAIRILAGLMLLYTHLVWTLDLEAFFGPHPWLSVRAVESFQRGLAGAQEPEEIEPAGGPIAETIEGERSGPARRNFAWSYWKAIDSRPAMWTVHVAGLAVFVLLTLGLFSRVVSVLAFLITVAYVNRVPGALFGLDQINALLAMYLIVGPCGAKYSLDRWWKVRRAGGRLPPAAPSVGANVAIRLIQLHMCVIYFFAGIGKLQGQSWWSGTALWWAFANLEYQTVDMTWLSRWPLAVNFMSHVTVFWEVFFCVLIWPRRLRPLMLFVAIPLHLGIGICLGMMTFGLVMLIGCLSFVPPDLVAGLLRRSAALAQGRGGEEEKGQSKSQKAATAQAPKRQSRANMPR